MQKHLGVLLGLTILLGAVQPVQAAVVYSNNFDKENGGVDAAGYTGFSGLTVTFPFVDLVHTGGGSGITCAGGSGGCVDLDGGEPGQLVSDTFSFMAGDTLTWTFSTSGSQRASSPEDTTYYGFRFDQPTGGLFSFVSTSGLTYSDDLGASENPFNPGKYDVGLGVTAPYDYAFADVIFTFVPTNAGTFRFLFDGYVNDGTDFDDAGRVIDNVTLSISSVPEPSTWAMAIMGFGLIGGAARRRRVAALPLSVGQGRSS